MNNFTIVFWKKCNEIFTIFLALSPPARPRVTGANPRPRAAGANPRPRAAGVSPRVKGV